jgi:glutamine synthetase
MNEGMLTLERLAEQVQAGEIETVLTVFTDLYGRFMGKRHDAGFFLESVAAHGWHACDYLLTVNIGMDPVQGYSFANWERGYGDVHLKPDLTTLRVASWLEKTALVICDVHGAGSHDLLPIAPRSVLRAQVDAAAAAGFRAFAASELEYYAFEDGYRAAAAKGWRGIVPLGDCIEDYHVLQGTREEPLHGAIRHHLRRSGVPVESSKGEWGKGQHELNVRYADVLSMADRHAIYKQCAKEVADSLGKSVTFMAKFAEDQAGSSCHIHLSLWRGERNAFPGAGKLGPVACSDQFRWFLGGWIARARELMVLYAPNVNSYKHYRAASWAPTRLAWSYDNRTAGFRVVGEGQSLRIECRIPGADCNPYLAHAAALASGLDGIANRTEPPPRFDGDAYAARALPQVPGSLREASELFANSDFARATFGAELVAHYAHFFRSETQAYDKAVTDWERAQYFEQI